MRDEDKTKEQLLKELAELRKQCSQLQLYKHVLDQLPVCCIIYDKNEKVIYRNRATKKIDGYEDSQMLGLPREDYLKKLQLNPGLSVQKVYHLAEDEKTADKNFQKGLISLSEAALQTREGTIKKVFLAGNFVYDEENTLLGACGCAIDISEQARKGTENVLLEQLNFLQTLIDTIPSLIFYINREGFYQGCNKAFQSVAGRPREEIIGKTIYDIAPRDLADLYRQKDEELFSKPGVQVYETICPYPDGTRRDVIVHKGTYTSTEGQVEGLVGVITDISERRQMEKEMARLDRLNLVGEMAAGIGHEVRNPMTTVRGFLQMLAGKEGCSTYKSFFQLMIEELDRANAIITEYLALAKNKPVYLKEQDLNKIIMQLSPLIEAGATSSEISLSLKLDSIPQLSLDEKQIRQLILNLVRNGLEAMTGGGTLTIKTFLSGGCVFLSVEDQGAGMQSDTLEKIGTPFFTTKEQGTGLGLAVCYSIAARHNAGIKVATGPGGSAFTVCFGQS